MAINHRQREDHVLSTDTPLTPTETPRRNITPAEAADVLRRVFVCYPSIPEWLKGTDNPKATFDRWAIILSRCDVQDVASVASAIESGDLTIDPYRDRGRLADVLRGEAQKLRFDRVRRSRMEKLREAAVSKRDEPNNRLSMAIDLAQQAGPLLRKGKISLDQNRAHVRACQQWCREGGPLPQIGEAE